MTFDEIAALEQAKQLLNEAVVLPLVIPEFFVGIRRVPHSPISIYDCPLLWCARSHAAACLQGAVEGCAVIRSARDWQNDAGQGSGLDEWFDIFQLCSVQSGLKVARGVGKIGAGAIQYG